MCIRVVKTEVSKEMHYGATIAEKLIDSDPCPHLFVNNTGRPVEAMVAYNSSRTHIYQVGSEMITCDKCVRSAQMNSPLPSALTDVQIDFQRLQGKISRHIRKTDLCRWEYPSREYESL
jgi:hypothetical protein